MKTSMSKLLLSFFERSFASLLTNFQALSPSTSFVTFKPPLFNINEFIFFYRKIIWNHNNRTSPLFPILMYRIPIESISSYFTLFSLFCSFLCAFSFLELCAMCTYSWHACNVACNALNCFGSRFSLHIAPC